MSLSLPDPKIARKRLKRLVAILETVDPAHFDMTVWEIQPTTNCGAVCCAVGWAMNDPWMQKQGLVRIITVGGAARPYYDGRVEHGAAASFFNVSYNTARYLFDAGTYRFEGHAPSLSQVIDRIKLVVASSTLEHPQPSA